MTFGAWRPVPANLWAMQAVVPPGTNDTRALQPVVPIGGGTPVAPTTGGSAPVTFPVGVPMPAGVPVQGGPPPAPGSPPRPVTPEGRFSPLPAGVIPAGQPSQTTPAAPTSGPPSNPSPSTPVSVQRPQPCQLTLRLARTELPPAGGEFAVSAVRDPANCPAPIAVSAPWLATVNPSELSFVAEPNATGSSRDTLIVIGGRQFYIRQSAAPQVGLAAVPGRLVFGIDQKGKTETKTLTAWAEQTPGSFVAKPQHPWLVITPKRGKEHRQSYEITVRPDAALPPGRHDTQIELSTADAPQRILTIPVVVEVTRPN
jgi:hypothetical protein